MTDAGPGLRFDFEWRISLFTALLLPVFIGLGFWQLQRAAEKAELATAFELRRQQSPAPLAGLAGRTEDELAYLPVALRGEFLPERYFLLDNRVQGGRFGNEVLGVMRMADSGQLVLVNRGWIEADPARLSLPAVPPVRGEVKLFGHIYVPPGEPYLLGEQTLPPGWPKRVQAVQPDLLARALEAAGGSSGELFPWSVRLDGGQAAALQVDWQVVNVSPAKHRGYAVQWFTMALALVVIFILRSSNLWHWLRAGRS